VHGHDDRDLFESEVSENQAYHEGLYETDYNVVVMVERLQPVEMDDPELCKELVIKCAGEKVSFWDDFGPEIFQARSKKILVRIDVRGTEQNFKRLDWFHNVYAFSSAFAVSLD
jgi:hypothetical protein